MYYVAHRLFAAHDRALAAHIASQLAREAGTGSVFLPFCDTDEENLVSELKGHLLFELDCTRLRGISGMIAVPIAATSPTSSRLRTSTTRCGPR